MAESKSGVVPAMCAAPADWAQVAVAAEFLATVSARVEASSHDEWVRGIREAAELVALKCRERMGD